LNSESSSATALAFRKLDREGGISEPSTIGRYIADILVQATNDQLDAREFWDFSNSADHLF
jgi:hypothetical protein